MSQPMIRGNSQDRATGLAIIGVAFLAALTISWWAQREAAPPVSVPPAPPTTAGIAGFPAAVDPVDSLEKARAATAREELVGISLRGVTANGMVDLTKPGAEIRYVFQSERGEGPQPPHEKGTIPPRRYCGRQVVLVRKNGLVAEHDDPTRPCHDRPRPLPEPRCGPKEVWQAAKDRHMPSDRAANIEYYRASAGPAWRFDIPGTAHQFSVYGDCGHELSPGEAVGHVP